MAILRAVGRHVRLVRVIVGVEGLYARLKCSCGIPLSKVRGGMLFWTRAHLGLARKVTVLRSQHPVNIRIVRLSASAGANVLYSSVETQNREAEDFSKPDFIANDATTMIDSQKNDKPNIVQAVHCNNASCRLRSEVAEWPEHAAAHMPAAKVNPLRAKMPCIRTK